MFRTNTVIAIVRSWTFLYLLLGALSGVVGIGGGTLIVPALVYLFHMTSTKPRRRPSVRSWRLSEPWHFGNTTRAGNADVKAAVLIAAGFLVGGYFGGLWAQKLPDAALQRTLGTLLVIIGIRLLFR